MTHSTSKQDLAIATALEEWGNTAEIFSHPSRQKLLTARKQALEERLAQQKAAAISVIRKAMVEAETVNTCRSTQHTRWVITELNLILYEISQIQTDDLPHPENLSNLANRLHRVLATLMYANSAALDKHASHSLKSEMLE